MSQVNPFGIFASEIKGEVSIGVRTVQAWSKRQCVAVWQAAVHMLSSELGWTKEDLDWLKGDIVFASPGCSPGYQTRIERYRADHGLTEAQVYAMSILDVVKARATKRTTIHGSEENSHVDDERTADPFLRRLIKVAVTA